MRKTLRIQQTGQLVSLRGHARGLQPERLTQALANAAKPGFNAKFKPRHRTRQQL